MTGFGIEYSSEAASELASLNKATAKRILDKIEEAIANPRHFFKRLSGRQEYKLRIGDYRVIAEIDEAKKTIFVRSLGHRKNVYVK